METVPSRSSETSRMFPAKQKTLSLFDVLRRLQLECCGHKGDMIVILDYEDDKYIFCKCDDLQEKFPTWKSVEIETIKEGDFLCVDSDSIYYMCFMESTGTFSLKDKLKEYFSLKNVDEI